MSDKKKNIKLAIIMLLVVSTLMISCTKENEEENASGNINPETSDIKDFDSIQCDWGIQFQPDLEVVDIEGLDENHIWALGTDYDQGISCIYFFDGVTWSQRIRTSFYLNKLYLLDETHMWLSGLRKDRWQWVICFYDGETITKQYEFVPILDDTMVFDMAILDSNHVWATYSCHNDYGSIHFFDGNSWTLQYEAGPIRFLHAFDPNDVWAAGAGGLHSFDGQSWSLKIPLGDMIYSFCATDRNNIWATNSRIYQYEGDDGVRRFVSCYDDGSFVTTQIEEDEGYYDWEAFHQNIWAADPTHVWVSVTGGPENRASSLLFFDGNSWVELYELGRDCDIEWIHDFFNMDSKHVWAIDYKEDIFDEPKTFGSILFYNGNSWARILNLDVAINDLCIVNEEYILVASEEGIYISNMQLQE
jgi:hypothetical protein